MVVDVGVEDEDFDPINEAVVYHDLQIILNGKSRFLPYSDACKDGGKGQTEYDKTDVENS